MGIGSIGLFVALATAGLDAAAHEHADMVTFAAGQRIPATLTLYPSEGDPSGRLTPIYNNYRPKIAFGAADVSCMFYLSRTLKTLRPGETGPVTVRCDGAVNARAGRFYVKEGEKKVGEVVIRGASTR